MPKGPTEPKDSKPKRILLVDDHPLMRRGQADLLNREPDLEVCGEAGNARKAMEAIANLKPDLVLVDIGLPDKDGLELIKDIHALHVGLPVLAMSMQDESLYAARVLRAGGRGYVMKQDGPERLVASIRTVLGGRVALSARMSAKMLDSLVGGTGKADADPEAKLTDRELEVMRLFGEGWSTDEIAQRLHLSPKTVDVHRGHIKEKLGFKTTPGFTRFAIRWVASQGGPQA
ncbi:MAG: response regulator transcription factor [Verrucomicrobia bacterium]|jgi:DNA-binding NarL/FixJ family response regulator|nr:response regulator transcription factor [Verrucomicrobiota bacterium]